MKAATLATICVFMTLALALTASGMGYGGYSSYVPVYGGYGGSKGGLGDGGLCKFISELCLNSNNRIDLYFGEELAT